MPGAAPRRYSSPTKIKTTYKLLVKRFGKAGALDIVTRNPGVLVNTAKALEKQSDEAILKVRPLGAPPEGVHPPRTVRTMRGLLACFKNVQERQPVDSG